MLAVAPEIVRVLAPTLTAPPRRKVWVPPRVMVRAAEPAVKARAPKSIEPVPPKVKLLLKLTTVPPATTTGAPEKLSRVAAPVSVRAPVPRALL